MTSEFERGYVQGFYTALKGTRFIASEKGATVAIVIESIDDAIEAMRADGDLDGINTDVDKLLELAEEASKNGVQNEFFDALEAQVRGKGK